MRTNKVALAGAIALLASTLVAGAAAPAGACGRTTRSEVFDRMQRGSMETVTLRTFNLDVKEPKSVEVGDTAVFKIHVTRPAKEDPLGNGIPMERPYVEDAPGAIVGVGLSIGAVFLPGAAISDENGIATVKIKIERWAKPDKWVDVSVYAWKVAYEMPCARVQEDGFTAMPRAFKTD